MSNSWFYAALRAGEEMARATGDTEREARYREAFAAGSERMDEMLWNGEYYEQRLHDVNEHRYQYGTGCLTDQIVGQFLAHVAGLGYILPAEHVRTAIRSIVTHNFREDLGTVESVQRTYALPGEAGLLICSWPRGGRPRLPFVYSDEVWPSMEYQIASLCFWEGYTDEGLALIHAARSRHDGFKRNPWNEVECGNHYARSMASWAILTSISGFHCDLVSGEVSFAPRTEAPFVDENGEFRSFFSTGKSWGVLTQEPAGRNGEPGTQRIEVLYGEAVPGW